MKVGSIIFLGLMSALFTSTAIAKKAEYVTDGEVRVHVSDGKISTFTETPAGDSYLPNSQVLIGKKNNKFASGLLGVIVEKERAKERAEGASQNIYQFFDGFVANLIQSQALDAPYSVSIVGSDEGFQFKLIPSARFELNKKKEATMNLRLSSRYKHAGKKILRDFYYGVSNDAYLLTGEGESWFGESGKFEAEKQKGFELLTKSFLFDASGGTSKENAEKWQKISWQLPWMKKPAQAYLIKDFDGYLLVANEYRGKPALRSLYIIEDPKLAKKSAIVAPTQSDGNAKLESAHPEVAEALRSNNFSIMREAAIKVGKEKLYNDEAIILTMIAVLENAVENGALKDKYLYDGLAWCAINLGKSGDKRAIPVLQKVTISTLSKKVTKHAAKSLRQLQK